MTPEWIKEASKHINVTHEEFLSYIGVLIKLQSFVIKEFKDKTCEYKFIAYTPEELLNKLTEHFFGQKEE